MLSRDDHDDRVANYDIVAVAVVVDKPQKSLQRICAIFTLHLRCSRATANAYADDNKQAVTNEREKEGEEGG